MGRRKKTNSDVLVETKPPQENDPVEVMDLPKSKTYVVVREGYRVSDKEYETSDDPECIAEAEFWQNVSKKHSYNEKIEIVPYNSEKHRIF
jgi:hypothetical protein